MQDLWSHPERELREHLKETFLWGMFFSREAAVRLLQEVDKKIIKSFFVFHDIGKATQYFQKYIRGEEVKEDLKSHAGISSMLFLYYHIISGNMEKNEDIIIRMSYAILRHHGDITEFTKIYDYMYADEGTLLTDQYNAMDHSGLRKELSELGLDATILEQILDGDAGRFINNVSEYFKGVHKRRRRQGLRLKVQDKNPENKDLKNYFLVQLLFSLLIDADKSQVVLGARELAKRADFRADVTKYIRDNTGKKTHLNELRDKAFREVSANLDTGQNIYTLTLPTGMGKTLNSLNYAIRLRDKLFETENIRYRIIYVMPFMSIIDQNAQVIEKVLKKSGNEMTSNLLCKHHHLTEIQWKNEENILEEPEDAWLLIEGWNSEIVITTFQQFFSTLTGHKNSMQRKFNKLCNSIVIIDEIQTIPVKYYKFVGKLLTEFAMHMDSKVIAMTATQPCIFDEKAAKSLCDYKNYYAQLSRTVIINELENVRTLEEFVNDLDIQKNMSCLFILNTIQSAKQLYLLLKDKYKDLRITYLSTLLPPLERLSRIAAIKRKEFDLVVSTQLVEAGVDIDFESVYRDFAPLPSIFQSAGRGNREGGSGSKAEIHLIRLKDKQGRYYADQVYKNAKVDLNVTAQILKGHQSLEEPEFMAVIEQYFEIMADEEVKSQQISKALINGAEANWFYGEKQLCDPGASILPLNCFELIEDNADKFTVFIELDEKAENIWKEYTDTLHEDSEKWEHKMNLRIVTRKMAEYMVDVRTATGNKYNKPPLGNNEIYRYVARDDLSKYYDLETGYGVESDCYYF